MREFDLDLQDAEEEMLEDVPHGDVVLGILDGTTDPEEWIRAVERGNVLVLAVEGDLNTLAAGFARQIRDDGGSLMHFRDFLVVSPEGIDIDTERL